MNRNLSPKDREFADLYFGGPDDLRGNATACYRAIHPRAKQRTCEVNGSRKLSQAEVVDYLESKREALTVATGINAQWVLEQSVRLYDRCMGDASYPVEYQRTDPETGIVTVETYYIRSFNPAGAKAALELIGRNRGIQAFKDNVEVSHTHHLEQALTKRAKAVETAALRKLELVSTEQPQF